MDSAVQRWWDLAMASLQAEQWSVAEGALLRLIAELGDQPALLDPLGYSLLCQGRYAATEAVMRRALALGAGSFWINHKLGDALRGQQRLEEAVEAYEQALAQGSDSPITVRNLLEVLDQLDPARAMERLACFPLHAPGEGWSPLAPWQQGAMEAAVRSPGSELAHGLCRLSCPDPAVRRRAWQEELQGLRLREALGWLDGTQADPQAAAVRQRLAALIALA
jgi:tetratricopeptide (TPR) repeat protein